MSLHWYVLRSKPHKERTLCRFVQEQGHEVFYPCIPVKPVNPRASKIRSYFPGYMFVCCDIEAVGQSTFYWMPFSQGLVCVGSEPARVHEMVIRALRTRVAEIWEVGGLVFDELKPGDRVVIQEGAFEGYEAIFDARISGSERVRVLLKMLNDRYMPLEVDAGLIAKRED
jgi:transcription antitermination factor NusG